MPLPQTLLLLLISMTSALQHSLPQNLSLSQPLPLNLNTNNSTIPPFDTWHPFTLPHSTFHTLKTIQKNRLQIATHPLFEKPVLIKLDALNEVPAYRLLHGSGATPEFYGLVTDGDGDVPIGFITEYINEADPAIEDWERGEMGIGNRNGRSKEGCLPALKKVHERGIAHGDAHDGNCLLREDGSGVWVDFELFVEGSKEEVGRDLDILERCLELAGWEGT